MLRTKKRKSLKKTAIVLCVPKIVATTQMNAIVADSTSVRLMELLTEVFVPTGYIGTTKKSKILLSSFNNSFLTTPDLLNCT